MHVPQKTSKKALGLCNKSDLAWIIIAINCKHTPLQCNMSHLYFISTSSPQPVSLITFGIIQRGIVTLFRIELYKSQRVSSGLLNSKTNDLVLLLKTIWRFGNCFLSPVATDGMDRNELKLEKNWPFFWRYVFQKSSKNYGVPSLIKFIWYFLRSFTEAFCLWLKPQSNDFRTELT